MMENVEANFRKFGAVQKQYFSIFDPSIRREIKEIARLILKKLP